MGKIIVESSELQGIVENLNSNCSMLEYFDEDDSIEDIWYYVDQIRYYSMRINNLIELAEPVEKTEMINHD